MSRPGPTRTSCLTCRRRHKKCDLRQPTCERCEKGNFECLGYYHTRDDTPRTNRSARRILPKPVDSTVNSSYSTLSELPGYTSPPNGSIPRGVRLMDAAMISSSGESSTPSSSSTSRESTIVTIPPMSNLRRIAASWFGLSAPSDACLDSQISINVIIGQLEKVMVRWYMKPTNRQQEHFRQDAARRLRYSKFTRWIALVGAKVIESFVTGDTSQSQVHKTWIRHIEGSLKHELTLDLVPYEIRERRGNLICISLMKIMLMHSSNTYQLLRSITPAFLQVAYSTPTIWSENSDLARIPLLNILVSGCHELAYFTLIDCTYAMVSGLPQQVEYDTTIYPRSRKHYSHQWEHSSPTEMLPVLADINACRDKLPAAKCPKDIEEWLISWQLHNGEHLFTESWMTIAWYAVQEGWRLALLIYLYLAVYDASSDNTRIQSWIKQILQVAGMVKNSRASDANVSFSFQYLMVGICARSEAHRKIARDKLVSADETRLWLMRAPDLAPVLDHLWHGAAADGKPIKWGDYVNSREAVLPVVF